MEDKNLDEVEIRCPVCRTVYRGAVIRNPFETQGICDWCAIPLMLKEAGFDGDMGQGQHIVDAIHGN